MQHYTENLIKYSVKIKYDIYNPSFFTTFKNDNLKMLQVLRALIVPLEEQISALKESVHFRKIQNNIFGVFTQSYFFTLPVGGRGAITLLGHIAIKYYPSGAPLTFT